MLFIFVLGRPPFMRAERANPHYANIANRNWERFWKIHSSLGTSEIPADFKDLIQKMLAYLPDERSSVAEIMDHPWVRETVATQEEAVAFFAEAVEVDEIKQDEREGGEMLDGKGYRSMFNEDCLRFSRGSSRNLAIAENLMYKSTKFFVSSDSEGMFEGVQAFFKHKGTIKVSVSEYKMKVDMSELECEVALVKMNDKYLIEMTKICGDWWEFYEVYRELFKAMGEFSS